METISCSVEKLMTKAVDEVIKTMLRQSKVISLKMLDGIVFRIGQISYFLYTRFSLDMFFVVSTRIFDFKNLNFDITLFVSLMIIPCIKVVFHEFYLVYS